MINVMLDPLPDEWHGYEINTSFRIGIQVLLVQYDKELNEYEKSDALIYLLFDEREHPDGDELRQCVEWFLNGWFHDKPGSSKDNRRLVDYDIDQWRIYADFRQIYGIDLSLDEMHWWMFNGLLWNMPYKQSSFQQVIEIRRKKITSKMGKEERQAIKEAQEILKAQGASYKNLTVASDSAIGKYASSIMAFTTTVLVDKDGNIVGEPLMGGIDDQANYDQLMEQIQAVINQ